jgi:prepilin-type N-terminal cleavage/methylation domain-containing protein
MGRGGFSLLGAGEMLKNSTKGFTLIEIVIVIVILSIVSAITIKFLVDSLRIYTMTVNQKTLFDEGKLALERMCRDIRDARAITSPASGSSGNSITFTRANATTQDVVDETITFRLTGSNLEKVKSSASVLASNVTSFTVARGATDDEITMDLTLSLSSGERVTLRTKVYSKDLLEDAQAIYKHYFYCWEEVRS